MSARLGRAVRRSRPVLGLLFAIGAITGGRVAFALSVIDETKLVPAGAQHGDEAGWAVAMSGEHLVVGVPQDAATVTSGGAVVVYRSADGGFAEQVKLTTSAPAEGDELGVSVDIDGDTIIAGAFHRFLGVEDHGKAVVFTGSGASWTEQAELVASDASVDDAFGWSVAIDGDWAAVGAPKAWSGSVGNGAVYLFHRDAGVWTFDSKLSPAGQHSFGWSVALDGDTLAVGSLLETLGGVFIYVRDADGAWNQQEHLEGVESDDFAEFGNAVALEGDTLFVGAWFDGGGGTTYVYERTATFWNEIHRFGSPEGGAGESFGEAIALDGNLAVITDSTADFGTEFVDQGVGYVFARGNAGWRLAARIRAGDEEDSGYFGTSAAIQGGRIVVGAAYEYDLADQEQTGAVYAYAVDRGSKLMIKNVAPDNESRNRLVFRGKGLVADLPFPGAPDDPTCTGGATASLEVRSVTSGQTFSQALPCANWEQLASGYRYMDRELDDGPCKKVFFGADGSSKAVCTGAGAGALGFDLEASQAQAPIVVKLVLGTSAYCTSFGGQIRHPGTDGLRFLAAHAGAPEPCSP